MEKDRREVSPRGIDGIQPDSKSDVSASTRKTASAKFLEYLVELCFCLCRFVNFVVMIAHISESEIFASVRTVFVFNPLALGLAAFIIGMTVIETAL
ncbi:MAG: hypothetical protein JRG73_11135 [Deltaproteobacteria bacterium]|nr:hypothetical protein [Deltaproteobacteria bacterium]